MTRISYYLIPNFDHSLIDGFGIASHLKCAVLFYIRKSTQHILSRNSNLVKHDPTIIFRVVSKFGAQVSDFYSR